MSIKKGVPCSSLKKWMVCLLLLCSSLGVQSAWAATKFLIIAPGQSYTAGTAPNRYNPVTQVAGETVNPISVYCYDDANNQPQNSQAVSTTLSLSSGTYSFSPASPVLNQTYATVSNSLYTPISALLYPVSTGTYTLNASAGSGGINADSTSLYVQVITQFTFTIGTFNAGTPGYVTIQARDASNLCDHYNGSATLYALDAGANGASVNLGTINFVNGVYQSPALTFYHATPYARFQVVKSNLPAVTTTSSNFTINAGAANKWLIIGPGQSILTGQNGGTGRASGSTATSTQTAGTNFSMTVYACDAYWNTVTSSATVTLSSSDTVYSSSQGLGGSSSVTFGTVNIHTVGSGSVVMTASGTLSNNTDNVPLTSAVLNHFSVTNFLGGAIDPLADSNSSTAMAVKAFDIYGNTVTTVAGTTTLSVLQNGTPLTTGVRTYSVTAGSPWTTTLTFTNGISANFLYLRKVGSNYSVRITNGSVISNSAGTFSVSAPSTPNKYVVIMPGQTFLPGEYYGTVWGRNGSASNVTAGTAINVSVVVTDTYGNKVFSVGVNATATLTRTDAGAVIPSPIVVVSGSAYPSITLTAAWSVSSPQAITVSGTYSQANSGTFVVVANSLHHFSVGNIGSSQIAGSGFNAHITAQDTYDNPVTSFAGPVYVTCPLLDYHSPEKSVINVTGGTNASGVTWTVNSGFNNGEWSNNITVYRAGTASIFVSDQANGTGHTGTSPTFTVNPASFSKMFIVIPGQTYRPGSGGGVGNSLGGYSGIPDSQQLSTPFGVTVYATDAWWNNVTGLNSGFTLYSDPSTQSTFDGYASTSGHIFNLVNGKLVLSVNCSYADWFFITANCTTDGIADYRIHDPFQVISIDHFKITDSGGGSLPANLIAGVPLNVRVVAYADPSESTIATTFQGQANLVTSHDYEEPFRVISPQRITFTNGIWTGPITIYRQVFGGITISCRLGNVGSSVPNNPIVHHNARKKMLAIAPGMNPKPGIAPDTYPPGGFPGYTGNPLIQEAGVAMTMNVYLCDDYWNTVTNTAQGGNHSIRFSSSDPGPATLNSSNLPLNVTLTNALGYSAGAYTTSQFKLYTVGSNAYQTITVHDNDDGGVADFSLGGNGVPPVNVKHTYLARVGGAGNTYAFKIDPVIPGGMPTGHNLAGVPFWVTITAQDQYGNPMDSRNGAVAFDPLFNVNLAAGSGTNTLYPTIVQLTDSGSGSFFLTLYKEYTGNSINADYSDVSGAHRGWSNSFYIDSNRFSRLIPISPGLNINGGGIYSSQPPTNFIGYSGSPSAQTAGQMVNLQVYACDIYGNVTRGATDYVQVITSDVFAQHPAAKRLDWNTGQADFFDTNYPVAFHKATLSNITATNISNGTITSGTTPNMTVNAAAYYGLATLAPGQILVEGSGNSNTSGITGVGGTESWYTGVTSTTPKSATDDVYRAGAELSGVTFPVTITAVDIYGNHCASITDNVRLQSSDPDGNALPRIGTPVTGTLIAGMTRLYAKLISLGSLMVYAQDTTNPSFNRSTDSTRSDVQIVTLGETNFRIFINGTESSLSVQAAPRTFTVRVEVRDDYNHQVVGSANVAYLLSAYVKTGETFIPAHGIFALEGQAGTGQTIVGQTLAGYQDLVVTYNVAEPIFIRVTELNGSTRPTVRTSAQITVLAGGPARIEMSSDAPNNELQANKTANIFAHVVDINGNAIPGDQIAFTIADTYVSRLYDGTTQLTETAGTTDAAGNASTLFYAGAGNETARIVAKSGLDNNVTAQLPIKISVTENGGVYPNPCNPASDDPKKWAHIDYRLDREGSVKLYIYTLFGDLVWHTEFAPGMSKDYGQGAMNVSCEGNNTVIWNGKNDNDVKVANGGYIAVVKVNDQQKYRFKIGVYKE